MEPIAAVYASALIALFVSALFGISSHIQHLGLDHIDPRSGAVVNIGATALMMWILTPIYLDLAVFSTKAAALFALAGLVVPAVSLSLATISVRVIGPSLTQGLASTSPVFAMMLAIVLIGEEPTLGITLGTLIVVAGVMIVAFRTKGSTATWPLWAVVLPLGAALARAIAHPVVKLGLIEFPSPMTAALIASTVSISVGYALFRFQGKSLPAINAGYAWFGLCGLINGTGLILLNKALEIGHVVVVSPIIAAAPAFTLLSGYLYFKREVITPRLVLAIILIFAGCVLITIH